MFLEITEMYQFFSANAVVTGFLILSDCVSYYCVRISWLTQNQQVIWATQISSHCKTNAFSLCFASDTVVPIFYKVFPFERSLGIFFDYYKVKSILDLNKLTAVTKIISASSHSLKAFMLG